MLRNCETCRYGEVQDYRRVITKGSMTIVQDGKQNIVCTHTRDKTITFEDDEMRCSAWKGAEE